jgi:hypothetical protein
MKKNEKDMNKCSVESECSIIDNFIPQHQQTTLTGTQGIL